MTRDWSVLAKRVIGEFALGRQVVYFTCHPATVKAFVESVPDCQQVQM